MSPLKPAAELAAAAGRPCPGDSAEYRLARTALLAEEIELRRHIERVAARRRALPPGGVAADYRFVDKDGRDIGLDALFGAHDTLVTYAWMFGPQRPRPRDDRALGPQGDEWPALDVWTKQDGHVRHFWAGELGGTEDPGQDARGAPDPTPLWNILDLTSAGRGSDWYPQLDY